MARTFRYRYVDIGTVFTGDSGQRDAADSTNSPAVLYANELACDVGGSFWGPGEPQAIIDHRNSIQTEFPSASAAVLSSTCRIREKFASQDTVWLVTHNEPEFDDFCSMYLARWIIEDPGAEGLGRMMAAQGSRIDWVDPDSSGVSPEHRWALLLTTYASAVEMRRAISCPLQRRLRSLLLAAMKRGRDYLSATSGATEFFDEVKAALQRRQLNPMFDSVLEGNALFAPELVMLDREVQAYARDLERARKAIVYLPESEAPTPDFFEHPKPHAEMGDDLLLEETFRIATDGIYVRDPQCALFGEWARVDVHNSALGKGFEFIAIAYSGGRPTAAANTSDYVFSIDPERADGRHLYTVWSRLQTEEVEALRAPSGEADVIVEQRHEALVALLSDPWKGGDTRSSTLVETPKRGTQIGPSGQRGDLRDDAVAEAVRNELENAIYTGSSRIAGPQTRVYDLAARGEAQDVEPQHWELNAPLEIPAPGASHFRFATVGLRADVGVGEAGIAGQRLTAQVADTLWQILYPDARGPLPHDFECHVVATADSVGLWGDRGIAVARKSAGTADEDSGLSDFTATVSLLRDLDRLAAGWHSTQAQAKVEAEERGRGSRGDAVQQLAERGEALARRALEVQHTAARPGGELLRRFHEAIKLDELAARLRDVNDAVAEHLRREGHAEEGRRADKRSDEVARARERVRWLEVFVIAFVALEVMAIILRNVSLERSSQSTLALFGGPVTFGVAVWLIQPWRRKRMADEPSPNFRGVVIAATVVWILAWLLQLFRLW